jgi:hypothetical protein
MLLYKVMNSSMSQTRLTSASDRSKCFVDIRILHVTFVYGVAGRENKELARMFGPTRSSKVVVSVGHAVPWSTPPAGQGRSARTLGSSAAEGARHLGGSSGTFEQQQQQQQQQQPPPPNRAVRDETKKEKSAADSAVRLLLHRRRSSAVATHERLAALHDLSIYRFGGVLWPHWPAMRRWDRAIFFALLFTVFVTPFEAAFLQPGWNAVFWLNRAVDLVFLADIGFSFFLAYPDPMTGQWVTSLRRIGGHYLKGWFLLDVISTVPFDLFELLTDNRELGSYQAIRFLRLLRLLKMFSRLARGRRQSRSVVPSLLKVSFSKLALLKFGLTVVTVAHWIACLWRLVLEFQLEPRTRVCAGPCWLAQYRYAASSVVPTAAATRVGYSADDALDLYAICIYWAISTLSTIGFGDAGNPTNTTERFVAVFCMVRYRYARSWRRLLLPVAPSRSSADSRRRRLASTHSSAT